MHRLLVLSHMFPRDHHKVGGIFVLEQVRALRRLGVDARVLSGDPYWTNNYKPQNILRYARAWRRSKASWQWHEWDGVPVAFFPYMAGGFFRPWLHAWTYELGLKSILAGIRNDFPYDLVHAHTSYLDGNAGLSAARLGGVPLVITEHTGPFSLLTDHVLKRHVTRRAVKAADHVIAVGGSLRKDMATQLGLPERSLSVLPNGYDENTFYPLPERKRGNGIRALWVGHFVPVKRVDRLIEAFSKVAGECPQLTLSLMGDGEGREEAERDVARRGLSDRILFLDKADRAGVADAMRSHDFLVVSSEVETFSLVTIESFACGLPVLSTRCGGPEGLILEPALGRLVSNDTEGLASGLADMCRDIRDFDPALNSGHARARYSWDGIARELTSIYTRLIEAGP